MYTDTTGGEIPDGSAGRLFYLPGAIPVGGTDESSGDIDTHAQFSRFWFAADGDVQDHKTRAYLEFDLFGGGSASLGNQASTNTHGVTLRQAYVSWDKWLAGQTWSNFQDVAALPDAVDFVGPTEGTTFVRQAQLRYTSGAFSVALENPQTVVSGYRSTARTISDDGNVPDITARWTRKGEWGHFSVAGLARQLRHETATTSASSTGFGASVSGKFNIGKHDDVRYMVTGGNGIGRYVGLCIGRGWHAGCDRRQHRFHRRAGGLRGLAAHVRSEAARQPDGLACAVRQRHQLDGVRRDPFGAIDPR